jgi:cytidylate kinase
MVSMGEIVIVSGPPGAGKSATADRLVHLLSPSALVPGDEFFGFLRNGAIPPWLGEANAQNTAVVQAAAAASGRLAQQCDVVYDGVVGPWFLDTFLREASLTHLHYALLLPPLEVCLERVRTRHGHGFTDRRAAEHMWSQVQAADVASRHLIQDDEQAPTKVADRVASLVATGAIRYP